MTVRFRHGMTPDRLAAKTRLPGKGTLQVHSVTLSEQQQMIFDTLTQTGHPLVLREILAQLQGTMSAKQVKRALHRLKKLKHVKLTGHGASARWSSVRSRKRTVDIA